VIALFNNVRHHLGAKLWGLAATAILSAVMAQLFLGAVPQALAHENPNIAVKPAPLIWGGEVIVDGVNFEEEDEVALTLVGPTVELSFGGRQGRSGREVPVPE
jgi:hypothetical protein